jgi:shikimate dehydrogenase
MSQRVVLIGHRIGYSASPAMQNAAFAACGLDLRYELADVPAADLDAAVALLRSDDALRGDGALGANVTQPHKVDALRLVDEVTPEVERVGALNTIVRDGTRLVGHNTDLPALAAELRVLCPQPPGAVLVLGAGGASRAAVLALNDAGAEHVSVLHRFDWHQLPHRLREVDLLVNATPIGTGSDESPVAADLLRPDLRVLDLVYRPSPTRLVREARAVGAWALDGAGMLLRQAALSFSLWTGRDAPLAVMRDALLAELGVRTDA